MRISLHLTRKHWRHYGSLIRLNKPIGVFLLLWPALWSLWLAEMHAPTFKNFFIFVLGAFLMRSAGCIINDFADRKWDGLVERTKDRPLATGAITTKEAIELFVLLMLCGVILVLFTNIETIILAFIAAFFIIIYPFSKRFTRAPQIFLGIAYSFPIPMAWTATHHYVSHAGWWLMAANFFWIISFDTYYAMVDREDDVKIGIKSTAILFGKHSHTAIALLCLVTLVCFIITGLLLGLGIYFYLGLIVAASLFLYQWTISKKGPKNYFFQAFLHNNWVGAIVFMAILMDITNRLH